MRDDKATRSVPPVQVKASPGDDSAAHDVLDSSDDETAELRGAIPPRGDAGDEVESKERPRPEPPPKKKGLSKWGPCRRWTWYRESRRHNREAPGFWRERDSEENVRGRLPEGEGVAVPGMWVAELYTPSTVEGLLSGIHRLGWEYGRAHSDSLAKWMNDVREGRQAGWTSLGLVSPPEERHIMRERTAPLPRGVSAAFPILMSVTPSITAIVMLFVFDDETAAALEAPLRAEYATEVKRDPLFRLWHVARYVLFNGSARFGHQWYPPNILRRDAVRSRLQDLEDACISWLKARLPGAFTALNGSRFPTAALLVTEEVRPLTEDARNIRAFDGIAIGRDYDAWESDDWPGARLVLPRGWDAEGTRLSFACRRRDAFPERSGYHEPTSNWTIAQRADDLVRGLLSRWALTCLLDGYHEVLSALRDRTARDGRYRPVTDLKHLRSLARTTLYDMMACAHEIEDFTESDAQYRWNVMQMTYAQPVRGETLDLLQDLRSSQTMRAQQVRREASLLQSTLSTSNDLSQTVSNIRIQRLVVLLTVVSIGIALWAVFVALQSL